MKYKKTAFLSAALALAALSGCSYLPTQLTPQLPGQQPVAKAMLEPRSGSQVSGKVSFTPVGDKLLVEAYVTGLTPASMVSMCTRAATARPPTPAAPRGISIRPACRMAITIRCTIPSAMPAICRIWLPTRAVRPITGPRSPGSSSTAVRVASSGAA